jgi:hypothetical protein
MRANYYIPSGLVKRRFDKNQHEDEGLFSLNKFFKKIFDRYKVSYVDDCCDIPSEDQTALPVRYNAVESQLEYYNPDNDTWTAVS